jgi:hypothetical protein
MFLRGDSLQDLFNHINSLSPAVMFTLEIETDSENLFLDVLVIRKGSTLKTKFRRNLHPGRYQHFLSNHPSHVKRVPVRGIYHRATAICQEQDDRSDKIDTLRRNPQLRAHPIGFIDSLINRAKRRII